MNSAIYDSVQCMICYQVPIYPKECKVCQKIICKYCISQMKVAEDSQAGSEEDSMLECPYCKERDEDIFQDIKNRVLTEIINQIKVGHRCTQTQKLKIFTIQDLRDHLTDCPGIKLSCPCQKTPKMTIRALIAHLKKDCGSVRIQCEYCHAYQSDQKIDQNSFSRDEFKLHKCFVEMQRLMEESSGEAFLYQKYKEEFEGRNHSKLEIKCFNRCGSTYY